ncbi:MAG: hypothetical protein H6Q25_1379 [Bacteroidetes bacterium]|nr:hypothetical protein [Bacteroidota bacterium]
MKQKYCLFLLLFVILFTNVEFLMAQTSGSCPPYPCPANINLIDSTINEFDTLLYGTYLYDEDGDIIMQNNIPVTYQGDTIFINSGVIYKFHVEAGCVYGWNTDVNRSFINNQVRTKITLFYDDFTTYAMVSPVEQGTGYTKLLHWRANYTGTVGIMVTRGEINIPPVGNECGVNSQQLKLRFYKIDNNEVDKKLVWGRYSSTLHIPCIDPITIYDSGLDESVQGSSSGHSHNENGYMVIYPEDPSARLKMWGNCTLTNGDTLFVYDGVFNTPSAVFRRFFTGNDVVEEDNGFFLSGTAGEPMSLHIKTDSSCVALGFEFQVTCCVNPGLPSNLVGDMVNDTTAVINWDAAYGSYVQYNWALFNSDGTFITSDSTLNTSDTIFGLTCNTDYYYIITVHSNCSNENLGDTVYSDLFHYTYEVDLQSASYHVCFNHDTEIFFSLSDSVNVNSTLAWITNIGFEDTLTYAEDHELYSFFTDSITQNVQIILTATSSGGCVANDTINIYEHNLPNIDINLNGTTDSNHCVICSGDYIALSGTGGVTYLWTNGFLMYDTSRVIVTSPQFDTQYLVIGTDANNCTSTAIFHVDVNPLPNVLFNPNKEICLHDSIVLKAKGLHLYNWSRIDTIRYDSVIVVSIHYDTTLVPPPMVIDTIILLDTLHLIRIESIPLLSGTRDSIWVSPIFDTDYLLTGTDTNGCRGSAYYHVHVNPLPKIFQLINPGPICYHDTTIIRIETPPDSAYTFRWWKENQIGTTLSLKDTLVVSPLQTTTYFVRVTTNKGCDTVLSTTVYVNPLPNISISANPTHVCSGKQSTLTANGSNIVDWEWNNQSQTQTIDVFPQIPTRYYVIGTDTNGCSKKDSVFITIDTSPMHELINNDTICLGTSIPIQTSGTAYQYHWYPSSELSSNIGSNVISTPTITTNYYVAYNTINGCSDTTFFSINVYAFPTPQVTQDTTICRGDTISLFASGGTHFSWNIPGSADSDTIFVSPSDTTTYNVTVYDYINCFSSESIKVSVIPYFNLQITASANDICENDTIRLDASGGDFYQWNTGNTNDFISQILDTTTIFSLRALNVNTSCSYTIYDTITVHPLPELQIQASDTVTCSQSAVTLFAIGNAIDYLWNNSTHGNTLNLSPTSTQQYSVTAFSSFGCTNKDSIYVSVNLPPADFSIAVSANTICYNESTTVTALPSPTSTIHYYHWNTPQGDINSPNFTYHPSQNSSNTYIDTIRVMIEDYNGCTKNAFIPITILPIPRDTIISPNSICIYDTIHFQTTGMNSTYFWSGNPSPNNQSSSVWFVPTSSQPSSLNFAVNITNDFGCTLNLNKTVQVNPLPQITITHQQDTNYFCNNVKYQFTAAGASQYHWSNGMTQNPIQIIPTGSIISVTGTDVHGCKNNTSLPINMITSPTASINMNDTMICALQPLSIGVSSSISPVNYLWNNGSTINPLNVNNLTNNTRYIVECYNVERGVRCSQFDTINIQVNGNPSMTVHTNESPICANETGLITISGAASYTWQPNPVLNTTSGNTVIVTPFNNTDSASYTFTVIGQNGVGCASSLTIPFQVLAPPDISVESNALNNTICNGQSAILTAIGGSVYQWAKASTPNTIIGNSSSLVVSPTTTTRYIVTGYNGANCKDTNSILVIVNPNPTVTVSTNLPEICEGFSTNLIANSLEHNNLYSWNNNLTSDTWSGDTISVYPLNNTQYFVTATNSNTNCTSTASINIKVNPSPNVTGFVANGVCLGDSITLTASGAILYQWFYDTIQNIVVTNSTIRVLPIVTPVTTYGIIGTDSKGCKDTTSVDIQVLGTPEIDLDVAEPGYLCRNMNEYLGITAFGNVQDMNFEWSSFPIDTSFRSEFNVAFVSPDTTTTYTVVGSYSIYGATCTSTTSHTIVVHDLPIVTASVSTDSVCFNSEVELSATGAVRYVWTSPLGTVGIDSVVTTNVTQSTYYIVVGEDSNRCVARDSVWVSLASIPPSDSVKTSPYVCYNTPTKIVLSGHNSYQWIPETYLSDFTDSSATVTLTENQSYKIIYTNIHGCSDSLEVSLFVNPLPNIILTPDTIVCEGHPITLEVSGGTSYQWGDGSINNFFTVNPTEPATYYATATNQYNCSITDSVHIDIIPKFDLSILSSRDSFCLENNTIILTAFEAGDSYFWSTGSTDSIISVFPTNTTTYYLTAFNNTTRCEYTDSIRIVRNPTPDFIINAQDTAICIYDSLSLNIVSNYNAQYLWNDNNNSNHRIVSPLNNTTYMVTATSQHGCTATQTFPLTVRPLPNVNIQSSDTATCANDTIILNAIGNGAYYQWNNGVFANTLTINQVASTNYIVTAFSQYGCKSRDTIQISIYPNPLDHANLSNSVICPGDTSLITLSGNNFYQFTPNNSVSMIDNDSFAVYPTDTTNYQIIYSNQYGCKDSAFVKVSVKPSPQLVTTPDTTICSGESVFVFASGGINYLWNTGLTSSSFIVTPVHDTTFHVLTYNQYNCKAIKDIHIGVAPTFVMTIQTTKDTICIGDNTVLSVHGAGDSYFWNTGSNAQQISVSPTTSSIYSVWGFNNTSHCSHTVYDTITVIQTPTIQATPDVLKCINDTVCLTAVSSFPFSYHWIAIPSGSILGNVYQSSICTNPLVYTTYYCTSSNNFCTLTDSIDIEIVSDPIVQSNITPDRCSSCIGSIELMVQDDYMPISYSWSNTPSNSSLIEGLCEGEYTVTVTDGMGCYNQQNISIVNLLPPEVQVVSIIPENCGDDGQIAIEVINSSGDITIHWYMDSLLTQEIFPFYNQTKVNTFSGHYWVAVEDSICSVQTHIFCPHTCDKAKVWIPNAFTPGGFNPIWKPYIADYDVREFSYELIIFNRWGQIIFKSYNYEEGWNGSSMYNPNELVQQGVYAYVINLTFKSNVFKDIKPIIGSINVLR